MRVLFKSIILLSGKTGANVEGAERKGIPQCEVIESKAEEQQQWRREQDRIAATMLRVEERQQWRRYQRVVGLEQTKVLQDYLVAYLRRGI